jgi:hypothetical protein
MAGWLINLDPVGGAIAKGGAAGGAAPVTYVVDPTIQSNISGYFKYLIPPGWFASKHKDAMLMGVSNVFAFLFGLFNYLRPQTRITTATDGFLDLIANDFFGRSITRQTGQTDAAFRTVIIANILRERATRNAVIKVLQQLTGRTPLIYEPARPADTGAYHVPTTGYGVNGCYGSILLPFQAFVTAYHKLGTGIPNVMGYGGTVGGYGVASQIEYASMSMIQGFLTDAAIYAAVDSVRPAGSILWVRITT